MRKILFLSCILFFSCVHVHSQERTISNLCAGVLINGVCWAESNIDSPGTFAATPEAFGMLYQWNRKKGWSPTGTVSGWDNSFSSSESWEAANDPCPAGWRVPVIGEIAALLDNMKVTSVWTSQDGVYGRKVTDKATGNSIFLPSVSYRSGNDNTSNPNYHGWYSSSSSSSSSNSSIFAWILYFTNTSYIGQINFSKIYGLSVRCVANPDFTGCDSIVRNTSATICAGDLPYTWGDTIFQVGTKTGKFRFQRTSTVTGCDSIVYLALTVNPVAHLSFSDVVCSGSGYTKNGFNLPVVVTDTLVSDTLQSIGGCDSIRSLYLTVHPVYDTTFYDTICQGDSYYQYGFSLENVQASGSYASTLLSRTGCDSIISLHLTVHPAVLQVIYDSICPSDRYVKHGFDLSDVTTGGSFQLSLKTVHGCDSIVTLSLHVFPAYFYPYTKSICQGDAIDFRGRLLYENGIYYDTLTTIKGCDSIYCMNLTVHPVYDTTFYDTICQGDSYYQHGFSLENVQASGSYASTLLSQTGCDSIISLHLTVHPAVLQVIYDSICPSDRYVKHGFDLSDVTTGGSFQLSLKTVHGCDSIVTLNLHVFPAYFYPQTKSICQGDTIDFRGRLLYEDGIYYDTLTTIKGCDSIYCMNLTVNPVYDVQLSDVLCEGSSYTKHGFDVSQAGLHYRYLKTISGCDSIITLNLTMEKKIQGSIDLLQEDCITHAYTFFFESEIPANSYEWEMGDGTVYRSEKGVHAYADSGIYRIQLHTETHNSCENTFSYVQHVPHYMPEVQIHSDRQIINKDIPTVNFCADVLPGMTCVWDFGNGMTGEGTCVSHTYNANSEKYYDVVLRVINADGCVTESRTQIEVVSLQKLVNTFSPNGDGINDVFMKGYRVEIVNRNGLMVYVGNDGWNGTYKGGQAQEDTYFYRLYYQTESGEKIKTGYVTLIR